MRAGKDILNQNQNSARWQNIFRAGGPRNFYPHSYVVSWYFKNVHPTLPHNRTRRVLDIGCGTAPDASLFLREGFHYTGIDITDILFDIIRSSLHASDPSGAHLQLRVFSPPSLPFEDNMFDVVIGTESLHFNASRESMLAAVNESLRVLKQGGHFFFTTIDKGHYFFTCGHSRLRSDTCLEISDGFPDQSRVGLQYYLFPNKKAIKGFFSRASSINIGNYVLDTNDGQKDSYYVIFGRK